MNSMLSVLVVILSGLMALVCAGIIAQACTDWYNISSFEGKAGYFVVFLSLVGGIIGLIIGFAVIRILSTGESTGFPPALGISWGIIIFLSVLAGLFSWLLADIPPEIDGYLLDLEVEFRLPAGDTGPLQASDETYFTLQSLGSRRVRKLKEGKVYLESIRQENEYLIIPAHVYLFTSRGKRSIHLVIEGKMSAAPIIPLPGRPGEKYEQWSEWLPHPYQDNPEWRDKSYRFRVRRIMPEEPNRSEDISMDSFDRLDPGSPLSEWLAFVNHDQSPDRLNKAISVIEERQNELAELIGSNDEDMRNQALVGVTKLKKIMTEVTSAVLAEGKAIEDEIRRFNTMAADDPEFYNLQTKLRGRFSYWHRAWWNIHKHSKVDARSPVQNILDLAEVRAKETSMDEIVINARAHLQGIK